MEALKQVTGRDALVRKLVVFSTDNYNFATDIEYVSELLSDVVVHKTLTDNDSVIGCVSYRGQICTIVDFESLLEKNKSFSSLKKNVTSIKKDVTDNEVVEEGIKVLVFKTKAGPIGIKLECNARYISLSVKDIFDSNTMLETETTNYEGFFYLDDKKEEVKSEQNLVTILNMKTFLQGD